MSTDLRLSGRTGFCRKGLMVSCATAAIAASILLPQRASAQALPGAFQGSIESGTGSYERVTSGSNETITIGSPTATLNWIPYDSATGGGPIDFLPTGHVATFVNDPNLTNDYTVLNRIVPVDPTRPIQFDGTVLSRLTDGSSTVTGGHVWFYSPGGIVVGSKAVFDVGGLLLSTADLPNGFGANSGSFSAFFSAPSSTSSIQVLDGAQINAANNYVALIAPRIEQGGTVNVNGSAAYVAGEQLTMSFNQGLFDVSVDVGTDDQYGVIHTGTTTGTGNQTAADHHSIYMVAVPKNNAIEMLLQGGSVGFTDATGATVENGQIILSAGYGVTTDDSNNVVISGLELGSAIGGQRGSITIDGGNFTSDLFAYASDSVTASGAGGILNFDHDVTFQGLFSASLNAYDGDVITVGGDANIHADDLRNFVGTNEGDRVNASAGGAGIDALVGGSIEIAGNATVTANALSTVNLVTGDAGVASAGSAAIQAEGGSLTISGNATVEAQAFGDARDNGFDGRTSFGGTAQVGAWGSGFVDIGGDLDINADARGSDSALASAGTGGTGFGGVASIWASELGIVNVHGTTIATAVGSGGGLIHSIDGTGGEGRGGTIHIDSVSGGTLAFTGDVDSAASGVGADSPGHGGEGDGGSAGLTLDGGTITAGGHLTLFADGFGGAGISGGNGYGGFSYADLTGGEGAAAGGTLHVAGELRVQAGGWGGAGIDNLSGNGGLAGDGFGGSSEFYITNFLQPGAAFEVQLGDLVVAANGEGGDGGNGVTGGNGGNGYGGSAGTELYSGTIMAGDMETFATARGGFGGGASSGTGGAGGLAAGGSSDVTIDTTVTAGTVYSYDRAFGGLGGEGTTEGDGGAATGGNATINILANGSLGGSADLSTVAVAGDGHTGGNASGGWSTLIVEGILSGPSVSADSGATGGSGLFGDGGSAFGGNSDIRSTGSSSISVANLTVASSATGGAGVNGGTGFGGSADAGVIDSAAAKLDVSNLATAVANGRGGSGIASGIGGEGHGGSAGLHSGIEEADVSGTTTLNNAIVRANGFGGQGGTAGNGFGGQGHAGARDGTFTITGTLTGEAEGRGGNGVGTAGGVGTGGDFQVGANFEGDLAPATTSIDAASLSVLGFGGIGSTGGDGYGGTLEVAVGTANSSLNVGDFDANVRGQGGDGADGATGGAGGFGYGGSSQASILGTMTGGDWLVSVRGIGGDGGDSVTGNGGDGGYGEGGSTTLYTGSDSSIHATSYSTSANGIGGNGGQGAISSGNGGEAQGGYNESAFNGTAVYTGNVVTTAFAMAGVGATGGDATGGVSQITVNGNLSAGLVQSTGQALGGDGSSFGGNASGGSAAIEVYGNLAAGTIIVGSVATGGNAATAGDALGGTSNLTSLGSIVAGDINVRANAMGGVSSADLGGDAFAGEAIFESHGILSASSNVLVSSDAIGGAGLTGGGNASGYSAALRVGGGTADLTGSVTISAAGTGGSSANGAGGTGTGGYARTSTFDGGVATLDDLTVDSSGTGGDGVNGGAGYGSQNVEGWGGSVAQVLGDGSELTLTGQTTLVSNGTGGFGSSGVGGDGIGGSTYLTAAERPLSVVNILMTANGIGGSGMTAGGNALGGDSILSDQGAPLTISGEGIIQSNAVGGNGGSGAGGYAVAGYSDVESSGGGSFSGAALGVYADAIGGGGAFSGAASGGLVNLVADSVESGLSTSIDFDAIDLSASGTAGDGAGNEGPPFGAAGFVTILAPGGSIQAGALSGRASGTSAGGDITLATSLDPAGMAGSMNFENVDLVADGGGGEISLIAGSGTTSNLGDASATADGAGGFISVTAGDCGCSAGNIEASSLSLLSGGDIGFASNAGGTIDVGGTLSVMAGGALTFDGDGADGTIQAGLINAAANSITSNMALTGSSVLLDAATDISISAVATTGLLSLTSGDDLQTGELQSGGDIALDSGNNIGTGNLTAAGNASIIANGNVDFGNAQAASLDFESGGAVSGGNVAAGTRVGGEAGGAISLGDIAVGPGLPGTEEFSIALASATSIDVGNVQAAGSVGFGSLGELSTGAIAAGDLILAMVGGDITMGSLTTAEAGQVYLGDSSMFFAAGGPEDFDASLVLAGVPVATSGAITIGGAVSTGLFQAAAGGNFSAGTLGVATDALVVSGADITANSITAGGDASVIASGNLEINSISSGSTLTALAGSNLAIASLTAGSDMAVLSGGNLTVDNATAADTASFFAGGLARFTGVISAPVISVTSSDIDIAAGASLGVFGVTDSLVLNAISDQAVIIGDQGGLQQASGQYVLNEDGEIAASNIFVNALGSDGPIDIKIYDVDIGGTETSGGGVANVFVSTLGSIFVNGMVDLTNAAASDSLTLAAAGNVELNTDTGGIQITNSDGDYSGILNLIGPNIWIGDGALLAKLEADSNFAGRDDALKTNTGPVVPDGYVRAGGMVVAVSDSFFVQNSGTPDAPAGLTVGDGGLSIISTGGLVTGMSGLHQALEQSSDGAQLNIFGHQIRSNGTVVSGKDFTNAVLLTGIFAPGSAINGCQVGNCSTENPPDDGGDGGGDFTPPPQVVGSESILGPIGMAQSPVAASDQTTQEDQADQSDDNDDDNDEGKDAVSVDPMVHLINTSPMHVDQTFDQPITSGNDTPGSPH